ncbi:M48 family metallopeptidase [Candidatus Peregrinibacteria bacterium]|nr:M48 family metallopeptidase [Candidatus Peregrinibacteria bacterium]
MKDIFFQGRKIPLKIDYQPQKRSRLEIHQDYALASLCYDLTSKQQKEQLSILQEKLYQVSVKKVVQETLALLQHHAPRRIDKVRFKKMTSRWGSASANHSLNFNLDLAKLPLKVQQYIIIHEYSHLFEMNHSKAFWNTVSKFDPHYRENRRILRSLEKQFHQEKNLQPI